MPSSISPKGARACRGLEPRQLARNPAAAASGWEDCRTRPRPWNRILLDQAEELRHIERLVADPLGPLVEDTRDQEGRLGPVAGDQDRAGLRGRGANAVKELVAVAAGKLEVEHGHLERSGLHPLHALFLIVRQVDAIATV